MGQAPMLSFSLYGEVGEVVLRHLFQCAAPNQALELTASSVRGAALGRRAM
jgi:hypothetical protein